MTSALDYISSILSEEVPLIREKNIAGEQQLTLYNLIITGQFINDRISNTLNITSLINVLMFPEGIKRVASCKFKAVQSLMKSIQEQLREEEKTGQVYI